MTDKINKTIPTELAALADFRYELRRFLHFSETATAVVGLHAQQYQLMQVVAAGGGTRGSAGPSIAHVAERMLLRHNSAVGLIDRTEEQGLLRRVQDKQDHRRMRLQLTARGERLLLKLVKAHLAALSSIGPEMEATLHMVLGQGKKAQSTRKSTKTRKRRQ